MLNSLRGYNPQTFYGDLLGGFLAALIALPYGLAMAALMGLPPILGVYTSLFPVPICVLLGRNPVLIGGVSAATLPFILAAVRIGGIANAARTMIFASVFLLMFCVLKLGRYVARVPHPVLAGFTSGIGMLMIISQLKTAFALKAPAGGWAETQLGVLLQMARKANEIQWMPAAITAVVLVAASLVRRRFPRAPFLFIGVIAGVIAAAITGWPLGVVGKIPTSMPPFIGFTWTAQDVLQVIPASFTLALIASVEMLMTSRLVDRFRGKHAFDEDDADRELGAYGIANFFISFFGIPTVVGIPARSVAAVQCGSTTKICNVVHGLSVLAMITLGAAFIGKIPVAALAGVTILMGVKLADASTWRRLPKMTFVDGAAFVSTAIGVLAADSVIAILVGSSFYLFRFLYQRFVAKPGGELEIGEQAAVAGHH